MIAMLNTPRFAMALCLLSFVAPLAIAQESAEQRDAGEIATWMAIYQKEAASYELSVGSKRNEPLKLEPNMLLKYSNPVRTGDQHGGVFLWTQAGRPAAVASIWSSIPNNATERSLAIEFLSLTTSPIRSKHAPRQGKRGPVPDWEVKAAGIARKPIADAPLPAKTEALRLVQMRRLAEEFQASISSSPLETAQPLRLQTKPLFRYSSADSGVTDGALFAYVLGTDPELFLLIEALRGDADERWLFAAARFTNRPLSLRRGEAEVWSCDVAKTYDGSQPYFIYWGVATEKDLK